MVSSDISYYIAVPISYHKDGSIDMVYAEERRKAFAELDEEVRDAKIEFEAMRFEDDYFYTQGRKHGKTGGKNGGRATKSKFSEKNLITFHEKKDRENRKRNSKRALIGERKYVRETQDFTKEHNLCPTKEETKVSEKTVKAKSKHVSFKEDTYFVLDFECFPETKKRQNVQNQLHFIEKQMIPLEIDMVNLTQIKGSIENDITLIQTQLDGWRQMKRLVNRRGPFDTDGLQNQVFPNWKNYSKYWSDDILHGIVDSEYPSWNEQCLTSSTSLYDNSDCDENWYDC